jgi:hypothetical protein
MMGRGIAIVLMAGCVLALASAGCEKPLAAFEPNSWNELDLDGHAPLPREGHAMVYDQDTGEAVLFGGGSGSISAETGSVDPDSLQALDDTWRFDLATRTWKEFKPAGQVPSARGFHAMAYDSLDKKVILFGGWGESSGGVLLNDTWSYDPAVNAWTELHPAGALPTARFGHAMVYDPASGQAIMFGGRQDEIGASGDALNDTWAYDPVANTWTELHPAGALPLARCGHAMVLDSDTGRIVLFGGESSPVSGSMSALNLGPPTPYADTWTYDPVAKVWSERNPAGKVPSPRSNHVMAYDAAMGKMILFGGWTTGGGPKLNDTWAYDPVADAWEELGSAGRVPSTRGNLAMVYDPVDQGVVLFGGVYRADDSSAVALAGDTWVYVPAIP